MWLSFGIAPYDNHPDNVLTFLQLLHFSAETAIID